MTASPIAYINGQYVPTEEAKVSILDRGFTHGDGVFETMRSYGGKIFRLEKHLDRLSHSAQAIFMELHESRENLEGIICETLRRNPWQDAILRVQVTRGEMPGGIDIDTGLPPTLTVVVRPHQPLTNSYYQEGVHVALIPDSAPHFSGLSHQIKSGNFLSNILARKIAQDLGAWEGVMLDHDGRVCDAATSNIFIVNEDKLKTPRLNEYVLAGITRQEVIAIASRINLICSEEDLFPDDLRQADEVFLTNTGIEILPVVQVEGQAVGTGKPGSWTRKVHQEFLNTVASF